MIRGLFLLACLAACGPPPAAHEYPAEARTRFAQGCPTGDPKCDCAWDMLTRTMTFEEYEAAMDRYSAEGLMDPRLTAARLECREAK